MFYVRLVCVLYWAVETLLCTLYYDSISNNRKHTQGVNGSSWLTFWLIIQFSPLIQREAVLRRLQLSISVKSLPPSSEGCVGKEGLCVWSKKRKQKLPPTIPLNQFNAPLKNGSVHSVGLETGCPLSRTGFGEWQLNLNENRGSPFSPLLWWRGGGTVPCSIRLAYAVHSAFFVRERPVVLVKFFSVLCTLTLLHTSIESERGSSLHGGILSTWLREYCISIGNLIFLIKPQRPCQVLYTDVDDALALSSALPGGFDYGLYFLWLHSYAFYLYLFSSSLIWQCHVVFFICEALWCPIKAEKNF